ncbi:MAG: UvrB/UvrC motif-containing protein [Actinobacteria bacterium]|nr:UvrB/UvrC motif-containing protein [Actinomycetota bacterium]
MFADESPEWNLDFDNSDTCEECGEVGAVIHLLRVENGSVSHIRLCQKCAENLAGRTEGMALVLAVPAIVGRVGKAKEKGETGPSPVPTSDSQVCTVCGTTLADVKETGMVGCSVCYQVFGDHLRNVVQGGEEPPAHLGKVPRQGSASDIHRREVMRLQRMLRELVECERFEEAASVRDRLSELERAAPGGSV